MRTFPQF